MYYITEKERFIKTRTIQSEPSKAYHPDFLRSDATTKIKKTFSQIRQLLLSVFLNETFFIFT